MASKAQPTFTVHPSWSTAQRAAFYRTQEALPIALGYLADEIPILDNHTDKQIVDEVGVLKQAKKVIEKAEKAHVERLKARMGDKEKLMGDIYEAKYRGSSRTILNQGLCKEVVAAFDEEGIHIQRLLAAIKAGQIQVPENVVLKLGVDIDETNFTIFHTTSDGGRALYVDPI